MVTFESNVQTVPSVLMNRGERRELLVDVVGPSTTRQTPLNPLIWRGVLVALLLDRRRPLIHYPADLRQWGVPLLAVVPHARLPGSRSRPALGAPA